MNLLLIFPKKDREIAGYRNLKKKIEQKNYKFSAAINKTFFRLMVLL